MAKTKAIRILMVVLILAGTFVMTNAASVSIYSDKDEVVEFETVTLTVTGPIDHTITVSSYDPDHTIFPGGVTDNPDIDTSGSFDDIITEEQTMKKYTVYFIGAGNHRIKIVDANDNTKDYVDITVVAKQLLNFDAPSTCAIGDLLLIEGTVNAGNTIDIAIDDVVIPELNDISIDSYFDFGVELDTSEIDLLKKVGSYRLKGYINRERGVGEVGGDEEDDGSLTIRMISNSLDVEVSKSEVETGDTFVISGTALGSKEVEILIISPTGSSGGGMESDSAIYGCPGVNYYTVPVARQTDDTFSKTIHVDESALGGVYLIVVFSRSTDNGYGASDSGIASISEALSTSQIQGKTQDQFFEILNAVTTDKVGSDDLMWAGAVRVEGPIGESTLPRNEVTIRSSPGKVAIGDEYKISGECYGSDCVNVVIISPKGGSGSSLTGDWSCGYDIYTLPVRRNMFETKIDVDEDADTGLYLVMLLSPGTNGIYDGLGTDDLETGLYSEYEEFQLSEKSQEKLASLFRELTCDSPGSDDVLEGLALRVETPYLALDDITDVAIGELLNITGTTNRGDGTVITVTVTGPSEAVDIAEVMDGKFSATMDTSDLSIGTYVVVADDGDGHDDACSVNIEKETQSSEPTFDSILKPTATPAPTAPTTAPPVTTPVLTAIPTTSEPTPEEPGFEAVFAITNLLAVAYLVREIKKTSK